MRNTLHTTTLGELPETDDGRPSKTQRKKEMHALQALGEELVDLSKERLARVPLPEDLRAAVQEAQRINSHEGRRRQLQYVGRLMRGTDSAPIREVLDGWKGESKAEAGKLHVIERWRERLMAHDDALTQLLREHPEADAQHLRALIRGARKDAAEARPPRHLRELFQALKSLIEG